ncbi:ATP-binding cassette domain-containing protein [Mesomycoplasma dispar]|uniref:ABC transporter domain-containing protein n=1 Tax=Mesomycoplasma dispar TaxID=86660 RepID=A0ABN5DZP8_9BACT|nr:ATP-binding cassette domain-containing protein [Mesomycoplasma dispar]ATP59972.1 hypothetical protein CSW10_03570 [Mesomycoplasma dispar]
MIKIENLTFTNQKQTILENVTFEINSGKIVFLVSQKKNEKEALINIIANFSVPNQGKISFFEDGQVKKNPLIDVVFQDFDLIEQLSIKDNILVANSLLYQDIKISELKEMLDYLGINQKYLNKKVKNLSPEIKRKVQFLRILCRNFNFILFSDTFEYLKNDVKEDFFKKIAPLLKNKTILITTGNIDFAKKWGEEILLFENQKISKFEFIKEYEIQKFNNSDLPISKTIKSRNWLLHRPKKFNFKTALALAFLDFKSKIISIFIVFFLFLATIFAIIQISNVIAKPILTQEKIQHYNLDNVRLVKTREGDLSSFDIKKVKNENPKITDIKPFFANLQVFYQNEKNYEFSVFDFVDKNKYSKKLNTITKNDLFKKNIENEDEVILSTELISNLKIKNPVGKKISIQNPFNPEISRQFLIVGLTKFKLVPNPKFSRFSNASFLHINALDIFLNDALKNNFHKIPSILKLNLSKKFPNTVDKTASFYQFFYENHNDILKYKLLKGSFPKSKNEIAISAEFEKALGKIELNDKLQLNSILKKGKLSDIEDLKVVGVFRSQTETASDQNQNFNPVVVFYHNVFNDLSKINYTDIKENFWEWKIYLNSHNLIQNITNFLNYDYDALNQYGLIFAFDEQFLDRINSQKTSISLFLLWFALIFLGMFLFGFLFYSFRLLSSKSKNIRVLKLLGGKTKLILLYHWTSIFIFLVFCLICSFPIIFPTSQYLYNFWMNNEIFSINYFSLFYRIIFVWTVLFLLSSAIFLAISWPKYKKSFIDFPKKNRT